MATAFVTGGTGFLGMTLIRDLVKHGWDVRALHRSAKDADRLKVLGAAPIHGDLDTRRVLESGLEGVDAVFHAAALFTLWAPPAAYRQVNVDGTKHLLDAAIAANVGVFVQIGAAGAVMGKRKAMYDVTEEAPLAFPAWAPYLATKAESQQLVLAANQPGGMRTAVVMPSLIWGPDMPMLEEMIRDVEAGRFAWPGGGESHMSTSHVDNVSLVALLAAKRTPGGRAYFVTDGTSRTLREIVTELLATRGVDIDARSVPGGVAWFIATLMEGAWKTLGLRGKPPLTRQMLRMIGSDFTLSDRLAREELGYVPLTDWHEGILAMQQRGSSGAAPSADPHGTSSLPS